MIIPIIFRRPAGSTAGRLLAGKANPYSPATELFGVEKNVRKRKGAKASERGKYNSFSPLLGTAGRRNRAYASRKSEKQTAP